MIFNLAINISEKSCSLVREAALNLVLQKKAKSFLQLLNNKDDVFEIIPVSQNTSRIISLVIRNSKEFGKICLSVSDDGTIKGWNLKSYLDVGSLLENPFRSGAVQNCAFSLGLERVVFCCQNFDICLYDLNSKEMIGFVEIKHISGLVFFSDDVNCIWMNGNEANDPLFFQNQVEIGSALQYDCDSILFLSNDGTKVAVLKENKQMVVIFTTKEMRQQAKFREEKATSNSVGQFSNSKDLLALSRSNGEVMIWKLDNHSRISIIRHDRPLGIRSICFSADEKLIFMGCANGTLAIANIITGKILQFLEIGDGFPLENMCLTTIHGKERFLISKDENLMVLDSRALGVSAMQLEGPSQKKMKKRHLDLVTQLEISQEGKGIRIQTTNIVFSCSIDGSLMIWKKSPKDEFFMCFDVITHPSITIDSFNLSGLKDESFIVLVSKKVVILWDTVTSTEICCFLSPNSISKCVLHRFSISKQFFVAYILTFEGKLQAWKILRNSVDDTFTFDTSPLFEKVITNFADNPVSSDEEYLLVTLEFTVILVNPISGEELTKYNTLEGLRVLEARWWQNKLGFCTSTTLYIDGKVWSYGGSIGDSYRLESCKFDRNGEYIGYSCIESLDPNENVLMIPPNGLVVIMYASAIKKRRLFTLRHLDAKVLFWDFTFDSQYLITLASDLMIRIWMLETSNLNEKFPRDKSEKECFAHVCNSFPLRSRPTAFALSSNDYLIYVGNEQGEILAFKFFYNIK
ncbi:hypothetical protein HK096_005805 [Nowakowskiella sp. JEL0078]|nr:hypothetical protein HK096_005805 [Nowakowskiella sp. JEL0078]